MLPDEFGSYGRNDAAVSWFNTLRAYLSNEAKTMRHAGLRLQLSSFGPHLNLFQRPAGRSAGAITTHIDEILGRRETHVLSSAQQYLRIGP